MGLLQSSSHTADYAPLPTPKQTTEWVIPASKPYSYCYFLQRSEQTPTEMQMRLHVETEPFVRRPVSAEEADARIRRVLSKRLDRPGSYAIVMDYYEIRVYVVYQGEVFVMPRLIIDRTKQCFLINHDGTVIEFRELPRFFLHYERFLTEMIICVVAHKAPAIPDPKVFEQLRKVGLSLWATCDEAAQKRAESLPGTSAKVA